MPNVALELDVGPGFCDLAVKGLEISDSFSLVFQLALLFHDRFCVLLVLPLLRLQCDDISGPKVSKNAAISNGLCDLIEATLELMHSAQSNMVHGCTTSVLMIDGGVLVQDVAVTDPIKLIAGVAILVFFLVEPERKSALEILLLQFFGRKGNTEKRCEEATDIMGGITAVNMAHKGGACKPLWDHLTSFHNSAVNSILLQKGKDLFGNLMGGISRGRT